MQYVREAAQAVQRNLTSFLLYAAILGVLDILTILALAPFEPGKGEPVTLTFRLLDVGQLLVAVHVGAFAQTVVFSRLGRDIDRPLWKVRTDGEALKRFFMMWALINLTAYGLYRLAAMDFGDGDVTVINYLLLFTGLAALLVSIPFGACIMFTGRVSSRTIGESLAPLTRQPGRTSVIFAIVLVQLILFDVTRQLLVSGGDAGPSLLARIGVGLTSDILQTYLDCLVFAATWQLCMVDRDTVDEIDIDF